MTHVRPRFPDWSADSPRRPATVETFGATQFSSGFFRFGVIHADRGGTTVVLNAGDKGEVLATNRLNDSFDALPVAVGQSLFLRRDNFQYALEQMPTE